MRPTYNFEKILTWISIFNAILSYAENNSLDKIYRGVSLEDIIKDVYQGDLLNHVLEGLYKLRALTVNQINNGDSIGNDVEMEYSIFKLE